VSAQEKTFGMMPLAHAAFQGLETVVRLLVQFQADVSAKEDCGGTALYAAAVGGHAVVVELLLGTGADAEAKDDEGRTALHDAARLGLEVVARVLLGSGADEQVKTNAGQTPEDLTTDQGHLQVAAVLKAEAVRRVQCVAFAMGHHVRLGDGSPVLELDAGVVRMVLEQV